MLIKSGDGIFLNTIASLICLVCFVFVDKSSVFTVVLLISVLIAVKENCRFCENSTVVLISFKNTGIIYP